MVFIMLIYKTVFTTKIALVSSVEGNLQSSVQLCVKGLSDFE